MRYDLCALSQRRRVDVGIFQRPAGFPIAALSGSRIRSLQFCRGIVTQSGHTTPVPQRCRGAEVFSQPLGGCRHNQADVVRRLTSILASASHVQASLTSVKTSWCMMSRRTRSFQACARSTTQRLGSGTNPSGCSRNSKRFGCRSLARQTPSTISHLTGAASRGMRQMAKLQSKYSRTLILCRCDVYLHPARRADCPLLAYQMSSCSEIGCIRCCQVTVAVHDVVCGGAD